MSSKTRTTEWIVSLDKRGDVDRFYIEKTIDSHYIDLEIYATTGREVIAANATICNEEGNDELLSAQFTLQLVKEWVETQNDYFISQDCYFECKNEYLQLWELQKKGLESVSLSHAGFMLDLLS